MTHAQDYDAAELAAFLPDAEDTTRVNVLWKLGWALQNQYPDSALAYNHEAYELARELSFDYGMAYSALNLARCYRIRAEYDQSHRYFLIALEKYEHLKDWRQVAYTHNDLAINLAMNDDLAGSETEFKRALEYFLRISDSVGIAYITNNLGELYMEIGEDSLALVHYRKAIDLKQYLLSHEKNKQDSIDLIRAIANTSLNIGTIEMESGNPGSAETYFSTAVQMYQAIKDYNLYAQGLITLGQFLLTKGDEPAARKHFLLAEQIAREKNLTERLLVVLEALTQLEEKFGTDAGQLMYLKELHVLSDSVYKIEKAREFLDLQTKYETEKKEQQIVALEYARNNEVLRRNLLIVALVLSFIIGGMIITLLRYRINKNKEIRIREKELADEKINFYKRELQYYTEGIIRKNQLIDELREELAKSTAPPPEDYTQDLEQLFQSSLLTNEEWLEFKKRFLKVYPNFFIHLRNQFKNLTDTEERLLALTKLNLKNSEIAAMLAISVESVNKSRYRLRKKLNLEGREIKETIAEL